MKTKLFFLTVIVSALISTSPASAETEGRIEAISRDMHGYQASLYRGKWFSPKHERFRKCVMQRESRFNYQAANKSSSARGAYQFLDSQWRDGLVWMMLDEGGIRKEIQALRNKPIHHWNRYFQDRAFWTAFRHGDGKHHWAYSGSPCNRLA